MKKIEISTIIRTVLLAVALINQVLTMTGHSVLPVSDEQLTEFITLGFTIVTSLWAWWKNNSFTKYAIMADEFKIGVKNGIIPFKTATDMTKKVQN